MDSLNTWNGWTIESKLGEGQYGKVYKLVRTEYGHTYESALKVIRIPRSESEYSSIKSEGMDEESITEYYKNVIEEIVSECALMYELKGTSNIVSYEGHQVVPLENAFGWEIYIQMELLTPLTKYVEEHEFSEQDVIKLGIDICKALELCQRYSIIHRDIKPENVFVSKQGDFKLGDFGIARRMESAAAGMSKKGTYSYMAPEVYKGQLYNESVDIYSLGIMLYRFANKGRTPFLPPYPEKIRYNDRERANQLRLSGEPLSAPAEVSEQLSQIILKACSYEPEERFGSAAEMRAELEKLSKSKARESAYVLPLQNGWHEEQTLSDSGEQTLPLIGDYAQELTDAFTDDFTIPDEGLSEETVSLTMSPDEVTQEMLPERMEEVETVVRKQPGQNKGKLIAAICALALVLAGILVIYNDSKLLSGAVLSADSLEMGANATRTLRVENIDDNTKIRWKSADPSIASVDENGVVTTHKFGDTVITASAGLNLHKLECIVHSKRAALRMDEEMYEGDTYTLELYDTDAADVEWDSTDTSVAEVTASSEDPRKASLTIHRCGIVFITAKVDNTDITVKPCLRMSRKDVIEIQSDRIVTDCDTATFWIAYSFSNEELDYGMLWADYKGEIEYLMRQPYGDALEITISGLQKGARTIEIAAGEPDGTIVDYVERRYLTVVRE